MIEHVGDDELELGVYALRDLDVFRHSCVNVPVRQAPDRSYAARSIIQAQDWVANRSEETGWVCKDVERARTSIAVQRGAVRVRSREDALLVVEKVGTITPAEGLGVGIRAAIDRRAASISEDGCECPPTEQVSQHAMLPLVVRVINQGVNVVDELAIEGLDAIHIIEIERIIRRVLAGSLDESSRSECLAPRKVLLQGDIVPIGHLERNEGAVVIPVADAGIDANAAGELAVTTEGSSERRV